MNKIHNSWGPILHHLHEFPLSNLSEIMSNSSYQPLKPLIFNVLQMPVDKVRVVILGQEPHPRPHDSIGYSFAVAKRRPITPSLRIIKEEIQNGLSSESAPDLGDWQTLQHWREQGVFLLNAALTVETGRAGSHLQYWRRFTESLVRYLSSQKGCIWMLWGKDAQSFIPYITNSFDATGYDRELIKQIPAVKEKNYFFTAPHPAAEAYAKGEAGFFGSDCFHNANRVLSNLNLPGITW